MTTEKELLTQLNNLKDIKPDEKWKSNNRSILLNQISGGEEVKVNWLRVLENMLPQQLVRQVSQPVWAVILIMALVFGGGIASLNASRDTKPGDSLYIAKVVSEKARVTFTFNEKGKAKLGLEFASNRTKEITQVLAETNGNGKKEEKVEKLTKNFKKEIETVKLRLAKINVIPQKVENIASEDSSTQAGDQQSESTEETMGIFSANLGKSDERMEISEPIQDDIEAPINSEQASEQQPGDSSEDQAEVIATTTSDDSSEATEQFDDIEKILEEAEKLFDEKDYSGTLNKLTEASDIIDKTDDTSAPQSDSGQASSVQEGEVKGESTASSTDNVDDGTVKGISEEVEEVEIINTEGELDKADTIEE